MSHLPGDQSRDPRDGYFDASHLNENLGTRSVRGGVAVLVGQGGRFVLQIASTIILARLLTPADFGLVAMVTAVTGFFGHFKDLGLTMATVQRATVTHAQASTLFWVNFLVSLALTVLCVALAPLLVLFYGEPSLLAITLALSLTFFFGGVSAQHVALLRRQMLLWRLSIIELVGLGAGIVVALLLAWKGAGYWALVGFALTETCTKGLLTMALTGWIPGLPRRRSGIRSMLRFGANVSVFNVLTYVGRVADDVLIGRFLGPSATGLYTKAYGLLMLPLDQVNTPMNSVAMPVLSRLQGDPVRYRQFYYQALTIIAYLTGPLIVLLAATADNLILLLLGPQWDRAADIFRYLAIAALFQPVLYTAGWVWLSLGRTKELRRWSMLTAPSFVASFVIGLPWGPEGVALAYAICVNALTPIGLAWAYRVTELSLRGAVAAVRRPYALSAILFAAATAVQPLFGGMPLVLSVAAAVGASLSVGLVLAWVYPRSRRDMLDIVNLVARLRRRPTLEPAVTVSSS